MGLPVHINNTMSLFLASQPQKQQDPLLQSTKQRQPQHHYLHNVGMVPTTSASPFLLQSSSLSPPPPTPSHPYHHHHVPLPAVRKALDFDSCRNDIQRAAVAKLVAGNTSSIKKCLLEAGFCDTQANNRTMQMRVRRHVQKLQDQQNPAAPQASNINNKSKVTKTKAEFVPPASIAFVPTRRLAAQRPKRPSPAEGQSQEERDEEEQAEDEDEKVVFDDDISVLTEISDLLWEDAMAASVSTTTTSAVVAAARTTMIASEILANVTRNAAAAAVATALLPSTTILPLSNNNSNNLSSNHHSLVYLPPPAPLPCIPTVVSPLPPSEQTSSVTPASAALASAVAEATFLRPAPPPYHRSSLQAVRDMMAHKTTSAVAGASSLFLSQQGSSQYHQQQQMILPSPLFR